jgi:murein DD-endopeptidase MepM/ murein hydrolase activator NlpD
LTFATAPTGFLDGGLPPIRLGETPHPRHERRAVNLRWVIATTVLALTSAALLGGVLQAGLHRISKLRAPEFGRAQTGAPVAADGRADRLRPRRVVTAKAAAPSPLSTQLLRSTGLGDKPLSVLVADLGHMSLLERPPEPPVQDPAIPQDVEAHDQSPAPPTALPRLIQFGAASAPAGPAQLSSYAPAGPTIIGEPGPLGTALNVTTQPGSPPGEARRRTVVVAQRGDTTGRLLRSFTITAADVAEISEALGTGTCTGGEKVVVTQDAEGSVENGGRPVRILFQRPDGATSEAALADDGHYRRAAPGGEPIAEVPSAGADSGPAEADDASLKESLEALAGHEGVGRPLVANVVRVMGTDRDLGTAVAATDRIELLYAAAPADDPDDQELDYAALTAGGRVTRLYRYAATDDNSIDYYDEAGRSLSKFLLRKPVAAGRLGDGFGWRIHPILRDRRFHEGVDYAAPYGSPIVAAGAGVVEKIDYESGYGKYIRIRHDLGYETTYAHVAGYPRGIAVGRRVQQGQTIAFIGSTGLSTGPHLYYEVKINDHNVDPTRIRIAAGRILEGAALTAFQRRRDRIDTLIKASRGDAT